jgi:beta-aspartyl-peptidase (threonine type)
MKYSLAIHGGAGTILPEHLTPAKQKAYEEALSEALAKGEQILQAGGTALDAVTAAVVSMEDSPLFNAGKGSVFTHEGTHEMDAAIMCGNTLEAGATALVSHVRNPIRLAREILLVSDHVMLCGAGAEGFAWQQGLERVTPDYFFDDHRKAQLEDAIRADRLQLDHTPDKHGTVGAVARDVHGNLAAATSTGGITNKKFGRVGDSPIIGSGTYANNVTCAVSCTGFGEFFIRGVIAYDVSCLMEYAGMTLEAACRKVIHEKQMGLKGDGGLIAVDTSGNIVMDFNSAGMYRGRVASGSTPTVAIFK